MGERNIEIVPIETASVNSKESNVQERFIYKAISETPFKKWKPSIHMPKEAARLFLEIKNIRVERLHDISEEDAIAEGIEKHPKDNTGVHYKNYQFPDHFVKTPEFAFESLWVHINGQESWDANPWVWVIDFCRIVKPLNFLPNAK